MRYALKSTALRKLFLQKELFLFDLDGVLVRQDAVLPGACQVVSTLKQLGKQILVLTNNSTRTNRQYSYKLNRLGFFLKASEIVTSTDSTLWYVQSQTAHRTCYVIGEKGLRSQLGKVLKLYPLTRQLSGSPDCVIVGKDEGFTYKKLALAQHYILGGAELIATNKDVSFPVREGVNPGGGALVAALEACTDKVAKVMGKPSDVMAAYLKAKFSVPLSRWLLIGDRYDTDIAFAHQLGIDSVLVETGIDRFCRKARWQPTCKVSDLTAVFKVLCD